MQRIRTIHALRTSATGIGISVLTLIAALYVIGREVWVARVFQNMPSSTDIPGVIRFGLSAFSHTHFIVQILILLVFVAIFWFLCEVVRLVRIKPLSRLTT